MEEIKDWLKAIIVVIAIIVVLYAAWLSLIIIAIIVFSYIIKEFISAGRE